MQPENSQQHQLDIAGGIHDCCQTLCRFRCDTLLPAEASFQFDQRHAWEQQGTDLQFSPFLRSVVSSALHDVLHDNVLASITKETSRIMRTHLMSTYQKLASQSAPVSLPPNFFDNKQQVMGMQVNQRDSKHAVGLAL